MKISIVYAMPDRQIVRVLELPAGATLGMAVEQSGLLQEFPEIDLTSASVGIFGRVLPLQTLLQPGDRVEIYRQLSADPKEARHRRIRTR